MRFKVKFAAAILLSSSIISAYAGHVIICQQKGYFNCEDKAIKHNADACKNAYAYWSGYKTQGYNCAWNGKQCYQKGGKLCVKQSSVSVDEGIEPASDAQNELSENIPVAQ